MCINRTIRLYILENFLFTDDESILKDDDSFLTKGIIDSHGCSGNHAFHRGVSFGIKVEDDEMLPEIFDSIDNLVAFIQRKQAVVA